MGITFVVNTVNSPIKQAKPDAVSVVVHYRMSLVPQQICRGKRRSLPICKSGRNSQSIDAQGSRYATRFDLMALKIG
jgi:hypothetical protein